MRDIIVDETIQDMDKNKDGKITLEEYISKHNFDSYTMPSQQLYYGHSIDNQFPNVSSVL